MEEGAKGRWRCGRLSVEQDKAPGSRAPGGFVLLNHHVDQLKL